jgi:hypothetical protein
LSDRSFPCPRVFTHISLSQVKAGLLLESELTNGERLSEAVYELSSIAPRVLTQVNVFESHFQKAEIDSLPDFAR